MSRATWKGTITFGLVSIPVALHTVERSSSRGGVSLKLYDRRDMAPVGNKLVNKDTGAEIDRGDVVKGFQQDGQVVVLEADDLATAKAERNQQVEIAAFVDKDQIPVAYFERPYYVEPQKPGRKGYALLRAALQASDKAGIAKVVISTKQYLAALIVEGDHMILELLRWAHEVKDAGEIDVPPMDLAASKVADKELDLAMRLVEEMVEEFRPEQYADETRDALLTMVEKKVAHGEARAAKAGAEGRAPSESADVVELLRRSLQSAPAGERPRAAARATRKPQRAVRGGRKATAAGKRARRS